MKNVKKNLRGCSAQLESIPFSIKLNIEVIKDKLKEGNITYEQFGNRILTNNGSPISKQSIYRWLSGKTNPRYRVIVKMSEVLSCPLEELILNNSEIRLDYFPTNQINREKVRESLKKESISYQKLGDLLVSKKGTRISKQSVSGWINGNRSIDYIYIWQISKVLKCNIEDII